MVDAEVTNDTIEFASPQKRGSGSVDVIPEDDGIKSPGATTERPMEDSTRAEPPTRTDSGSAIALVKRAARRASSALLSLKSTSSRDLFFSKSNTGPSWLRKLSAARRSADSRESIDEQSMSSKSAKGVARDALDRADAATSFRPLPRELLDDGFKVPNFDVTRLQDIGDRPTGRGCQAYIWRCIVPEGKKAGQIVGVLTRLANDTGPDPLADGKSRSIRSRISGGTKWLGLRSKSKSPKFGADRKHYYPDDDTA